MKYFVCLLLLLPTNLAFAIPSPELITSATQAILSTLGTLTAILIITAATVSRFFQTTWHQYRKIIIVGLVGLTLIIGSIVLLRWSQYTNEQAMLVNELGEIWDTYNNMNTVTEPLTTHSNTHNAISWNEFITLAGDDYLVLDVRDAIPYQDSHVPGSKNIRFTDLLAGDWQNIIAWQNKPIYIICYESMTGQLTSTFLESQGFSHVYHAPNGLLGQQGNIPLSEPLTIPHTTSKKFYVSNKKIPDYDWTQQRIFIDMRATKDELLPVTNTLPFERGKATTPEITTFINSLPRKTPVTIACDSILSCYQADIMILELLNRGYVGLQVIDYYR